MHAEQLLCTVRLPSLMLIAQAIFLFQHGHRDMTRTHKVTDATYHPAHSSATASEGII